MDNIIWGGSGIEKVVFDYILSIIPIGSTVVELGAGNVSTRAFSLHYKTYSAEHNEEFVGLFENVNYIFAPEVDGWYDREILEMSLPPKEDQKLIFIDGVGRRNILDNMDLFNPNAVYLIHDTYREKEIELAHDLALKLNRTAVFHTEGDFWATI